jgi:transposase
METDLKYLSKETLISQLRSQDISIKEQDVAIKKLGADLSQKEQQVRSLVFQLSEYKRLVHGSKRERFISENNPQQQMLPFTVDVENQEVEHENINYSRVKKQRSNHPGRLALPDHLDVKENLIEPEDDTAGLKCIGQEVTDELEFIPSRLFINRFIRPKYAMEDGEGILIADLPTRPIEKAIAGPGLLSQIMVDKFVDHLPIYRQVQRFKRENISIASSTINSWQEGVFRLLTPLYDALKNQVLSEGYLQADETPIGVLDKQKKGKTHRGYHWVYHSPMRQAVFFDYREGRGRDGPKTMLKDFKGYLQTDGYSVYQWFGKQKGITLLGCMAHARRYFDKALDDDKARASHMMNLFQKLYDIERKAREGNFMTKERHELRLEKSLPILNEMGKYMAEQFKEVPPASPLGKALGYSISRWDQLTAYLYDGELEIDNNQVENSIRPTALGRKNYLFAGSHNGARRAAMMYSFFGTCKKNGVNPYKWLKKVLEIIPDYPVNRVHELLPHNLKE